MELTSQPLNIDMAEGGCDASRQVVPNEAESITRRAFRRMLCRTLEIIFLAKRKMSSREANGSRCAGDFASLGGVIVGEGFVPQGKHKPAAGSEAIPS